jgi:hypothetical protein
LADFDPTITLGLLKARMGIKVDALDGYLTQLVKLSYDKIVNQMGIVYDETRFDHAVLLSDYAAWRYQSRDSSGDMPPWLKLELRELYLSSHAQEVTDAVI